MSFTDRHCNTLSSTGVIFLARLIVISSLAVKFTVGSSIGGATSSSGSGGVNGIDTGGSTSSLSISSSGSVGGGGSGSGSNYYSGTEVWCRNLDSQLLRLGSRLDQLMIRMDHLDSRVGRVQSQGHLRFDSIETSMQTTRQRLDLWSNQLNLIEEQLSRRWKNMESRFDSLVNSIDTKLDTKFNLIQRDNRRHNEFISSSFNSVIISQEKLSERVVHSVAEMNSSIAHTRYVVSNSTASLLTRLSGEYASSANNSDRVINLLETFVANLTTTKSCSPQQNYKNNNLPLEQLPLPSSMQQQHSYNKNPFSSQNQHSPQHHHHHNHSQVQLITTKVNNMFDELEKRSLAVEELVKDTFTMSNLTRREVQDGFRALIPVANQISQLSTSNSRGLNGARSISSLSSSSGSSAEVMSMVVEALASVESMSTALGRRMSELSRSIEERFEMVSMTLNGFLESCLRIQERAPLIEEHIAIILERILDTVDNSTKNATETWYHIQEKLLKGQHPARNTSSCSESLIIEQYLASLQQKHQSLQNQQQQQPFSTSTTVQGHHQVTSGGENNKSKSLLPNPWGFPPPQLPPKRTDGTTDTEAQVGEGDDDNGGIGIFGDDEEDDNNEGDDDESGEPVRIGQSKLLFRGGSENSKSNTHHLRHQHLSNIMMNLPTSTSSSTTPLTIPQGGAAHAEGQPSFPPASNSESEALTGNLRTSMISANSLTHNNNHNYDNANLPQQGFTTSSSLSSMRSLPGSTTTNTESERQVSAVSTGVRTSFDNTNVGDPQGSKLSEEEKKSLWESWLAKVPE